MKVGILGTGYVGLVTGVCLAARGHLVTCFDIKQDVVDTLNRGRPHIHEQGLEELLRRVLGERRFHAELASPDGLSGHDILLIAVGTPSRNGRIDLSFVESAARLVGQGLRDSRVCSVVVKSTVLPGTTDTLVRSWLEETSGKRWDQGGFGLGMNPEFLREGSAVEDFLDPDRIVLGHEDALTLERLQQLYQPWSCDKLLVNTRTAEMIKYVNNCLLALQISAVNELANIAAAQGGIDMAEVLPAVHLDRRWNPILSSGERANPGILSYLWPGCGFGGSCFPKDVEAMRTHAKNIGVQPRMLQAILDVNGSQPLQVSRLLTDSLGPLENKTVLVLGLAFKPDTDDVRESASLSIIADLLLHKARVTAHDPIAMPNARRVLAGQPIVWLDDWKPGVVQADAIVIATKWSEYRELPSLLLSSMHSHPCPSPSGRNMGGENSGQSKAKTKVVVDARRMFSPNDFPKMVYRSIGRGAC